MATNLRLRPETEDALRKAAERSGRSQQELIREALDRYLGLDAEKPSRDSLDDLIAKGIVLPPREPYRRAEHLFVLPAGVSSLELLDRDDRI